ncbi:MAG: hypothetical protein ACREOO_01015 [bacterium]
MDRLEGTVLRIFFACCLMLTCCGSNSGEQEYGEAGLRLIYLNRFNTGEFVFTAQEEGNEIIKLNVGTQEVADRRALA